MKFSKGSQIREGKAKILYETTPPSENVIQFFKDDATAFNALKKGTIENKGVINNSISSWIFEHLEKNGVRTHFVDRGGDREMVARKVRIIPVEVVIRNRAAGSICKRLGIEKGKAFATPLIEFFLKDDGLGDPLIGETHIYHFGWASPEQIEVLKKSAFRVNEVLKQVFAACSLELIDFKLEYGVDSKTGEILLADEFTPDGCRLWDMKTGESMDKDRFRHDMGNVAESYQEVWKRLSEFFGSRKQ